MAALPLRAPPPAAVAAASRISRPFHGAMNAHPLGRLGPSSAPVKLQARTLDSFRSHCEKRADRLNEPDPEPENHDPDKVSPQTRAVQNRSISSSAGTYLSVCFLLFLQAATQQNYPLVEELLNYKQALLAAMGVVSVSGDGYQPLVISYC